MKKKTFFLCFILLSAGCSMYAQKAYTYIQQNNEKIEKLGTMSLSLSSECHPVLEFDENGKAIMSLEDNPIAVLPMRDGGQLVVEFETTLKEEELDRVTKTFSNPYATLYSPFQLHQVFEGDVVVYDPCYNPSTRLIELSEIGDAIIPVETPLILQHDGTATFSISSEPCKYVSQGNLSGSSLSNKIPEMSSEQTVFTLGHETNDKTKYGFFAYTGSTLGAGLCYLIADKFTDNNVRPWICFGDEGETSLPKLLYDDTPQEKVSRYNLFGQRVNTNAKGIVLYKGKKYISR